MKVSEPVATARADELAHEVPQGSVARGKHSMSAAFRLVCLALLVRLALLVVTHGFVFVESRTNEYASFFNETTNLAGSVAQGSGYSTPFVSVLFGDADMGPSSWVAPAYPYLCAGIFRLFGAFSQQSFLIIVLLQCVFSALTCIPILGLGEMTVGRRAGVLAGLLWTVMPCFSQWAITWIWEVELSALLFTCLFWYALWLDRRGSLRNWAGFGAAWGFAILVNPSLMTLLGLSVLWVGYRKWKRGEKWVKQAVLAAVLCVTVISPWMIRNRVVFGDWVFVRSNFWFEFEMANYHGTYGQDSKARHPYSSPTELAEYKALGELGYTRAKAVKAKQFLREYPGEFATITAKRIVYFWNGRARQFADRIAPIWLPWLYKWLSLAGLAGLLFASLKRVHGWPLFTTAILLYPLPYYITYSQLRYRHVIEPLLLLLIAYGIVEVSARLRGQKQSPLRGPSTESTI
jgi:4-amino-4-deoxy-L-arabinose transferase-like glycosyltransferase